MHAFSQVDIVAAVVVVLPFQIYGCMEEFHWELKLLYIVKITR